MKTMPYLIPSKKASIKADNKSANKFFNQTPEEDKKLQLCDFIYSEGNVRFMKIHTNMMEEEGFFKEDTIVIDPVQIPVTGKFVVVKIDDELLIRRYDSVKKGYLLSAPSHKVSPLHIEHGYEKATIIGVVAFVIKNV